MVGSFRSVSRRESEFADSVYGRNAEQTRSARETTDERVHGVVADAAAPPGGDESWASQRRDQQTIGQSVEFAECRRQKAIHCRGRKTPKVS